MSGARQRWGIFFVSKITQSARGENCTFLIRNVCQNRTDTTVFCHGPLNFGRGIKSPDWWGAYGCYECHTAMDQRKLINVDWLETWLAAIRRTQTRLIEKGLLEVK